MPLTNAEKISLLDFLNGKSTLTPRTTIYVGLHIGTDPPDFELGTGYTEPTDIDSNYARIAATQASLWNAATNADPVYANTSTVIDFGGTVETAYASPITYVLLFESASATSFFQAFTLSSSITPADGETIKIPAGNLISELGGASDTYTE